MPTYEYACTSCGQHVEVFQRISDEPLTECGACGSPLRKVFFPAGILFKGSGFYSTDNRSAPSKDDKDKDSGAAAEKAGSKADSKTDSKGSEKKGGEKKDSSGPAKPDKPAKPKEKSA